MDKLEVPFSALSVRSPLRSKLEGSKLDDDSRENERLPTLAVFSVYNFDSAQLIQVAHNRLSRDSSTVHSMSLGKNLFCAELSHLQNRRN